LDEAAKEGAVYIKNRNWDSFCIKPAESKNSPLDVEGVDLGLTSQEIVDVIREGRQRDAAC
jgi:hypothetical protein